MSEYDKKYFRRKFYPTQRDGAHSSYHSTRPYSKNTLFRYDREYKDVEKPENKEKTIQQPTILQKARTERSVSPKRSKENEQASSTSTSNHEVISTPVPMLSSSIKLIDEGTLTFESVQEYLQDSPDFLVVGVIGNQGVGKSTIMNLIAQNKITKDLKDELFNYSSDADVNNSESIKILTENVTNLRVNDAKEEQSNIIFKPQSLEQIENGFYGTNGVDLYITNNRVFLLDCQPVISAAILDEIAHNDAKRTIAGEFLPTENCAEIQSLQFATFILSVCHVVILVQDWFFDTNFVRFLQTAEMLKPSIPMAEEEFMEYFPHVMLIHNRATLEDFTPTRFKIIQNVYREVFNKSKLRFDSGMGLGTGKIIHCLNPATCGDPLNFFLLPDYDEEEKTYRGHPPFDDLIRELRTQIHSVTRIPLFSSQLTEKKWLQFSTRIWDTIRKSSFFLEYSKLMP